MSQTTANQQGRSSPLGPWLLRVAAILVAGGLLANLSLAPVYRNALSNTGGNNVVISGVMVALEYSAIGVGFWIVGLIILISIKCWREAGFSKLQRDFNRQLHRTTPRTLFLDEIHGKRTMEMSGRQWRKHLRKLNWQQWVRALCNGVGLGGVTTILTLATSTHLVKSTVALTIISGSWMTLALVAGTLGARSNHVLRFQVWTTMTVLLFAVCGITVAATPYVTGSPIVPYGLVFLAATSSATVAYSIGRLVARWKDAGPLEKALLLIALNTGTVLGIATLPVALNAHSLVWTITGVVLSSGVSSARSWPARLISTPNPVKVSELGSALGYAVRLFLLFAAPLVILHVMTGNPIPVPGPWGPGGTWWALSLLVGVINFVYHQCSQVIANAPNGNTLVGSAQLIGNLLLFVLSTQGDLPLFIGTIMFGGAVVALAKLDAVVKARTPAQPAQSQAAP